ncbi:MAG: PadR family transcriptional regulator [Glycomyces artemisiae]|uniref:PadR family transcriptional regulator n=2 Tax=Glycomyces artemisiae TaxID=1076443 RepID=A0A850C8Y9_9ACTN|nr:PadR family transcriptional regulator [Glycomyces artemisiae]NUQ87366.1 PadR family transcriptional regulator [Glycomyces artemisiae]
MESKFAAMRRGMLEPVVLAALDGESRYAGEIAQLLRDAQFPVQDGTLHPLLNRLRREGLLTYEWRESPSGPPRKYLALSDEGRAQLAQFRDYFRGLATMIESIGR